MIASAPKSHLRHELVLAAQVCRFAGGVLTIYFADRYRHTAALVNAFEGCWPTRHQLSSQGCLREKPGLRWLTLSIIGVKVSIASSLLPDTHTLRQQSTAAVARRARPFIGFIAYDYEGNVRRIEGSPIDTANA